MHIRPADRRIDIAYARYKGFFTIYALDLRSTRRLLGELGGSSFTSGYVPAFAEPIRQPPTNLIKLDGDISNPEHTESIRLTPNRTRAGRDASMDVSGARYARGMINVPRFHRSKLKMVRPLTGTIHHICLYGLH